jgi:hypothetical protein
MTKKKTKQPKNKEIDYAEFSIRFTKLCIKLSLKFTMLIYSISKYIYKRIQVWLAWRQLKKDVRECAACRDYFSED